MYKTRDTIIEKHVRGRDIHFLLRGHVVASDMAAAGGAGRSREENVFEQCLFTVHEAGAFFGEQSMLSMSSRSTLSFTAAGPVELLSMEADDLTSAANEHLDDAERMSLAEQIWHEFKRKMWQRLWGHRILIADLIEKGNLLRERYESGGKGGGGVTAADLRQNEEMLAARRIQKFRLHKLVRERELQPVETMVPSLVNPMSDRRSAKSIDFPGEEHQRQHQPHHGVLSSAVGTVSKVAFALPHAQHRAAHSSEHPPVSSEALSALGARLDDQGRQIARLDAKLDEVLKALRSHHA